MVVHHSPVLDLSLSVLLWSLLSSGSIAWIFIHQIPVHCIDRISSNCVLHVDDRSSRQKAALQLGLHPRRHRLCFYCFCSKLVEITISCFCKVHCLWSVHCCVFIRFGDVSNCDQKCNNWLCFFCCEIRWNSSCVYTSDWEVLRRRVPLYRVWRGSHLSWNELFSAAGNTRDSNSRDAGRHG